jgi:hypothetical protein
MTKQCVLMRHGLALYNSQPIGTCCYNSSDPATHTSYDIDPVHCRACIEQEENQQHSYRMGANQKYGLVHAHNDPIVLDLTPNRNCNLACCICSENSSSTWAKLKKIPITQSYNISVKKTVEKLKDINLINVREINFSGGEPLLNSNIVKYLQTFEDRINFSQCTLRFSTNGSQKITPSQLDFFQKFKLVLARFSLDDIEHRHEYQRYPSKWKEWQQNWDYFLNTIPHNVIPSINRTVGILNIANLDDLNQWHQQRPYSRFGDQIDLIDHFVMGPYSLNNLTEPLKQYIFNKCGPDSLSWKYVQNRRTVHDTTQLKEAIHLNDSLQKKTFQNVDPELYNIIFK